MNKIVLITGATSGIGKATAYKFAQNNFNIIITGRRKNILNKIALDLEGKYKIKTLCLNFDISDRIEVENVISNLPSEFRKIDVLVNNAGLALGLNPIHKGIVEDWEQMIDTNIKGLLYMTKNIVTLMIENGSGHIINIGSIAGKEVYPNGNVYCASKFAVDALTKAMRIDLINQNIRVTQVAPGAVNTEFSLVRFKGDSKTAENVYNGYQPLLAEDVAGVIYYVTTLPSNVNINDITVMPMAQANTYVINRL